MMKRIINKSNRLSQTLILILFFLQSCATEPGSIQSGVFIDSPVEGLMYQSGRLLGRTDSNGTFYYEEGDTVIFSIEGVVIGEPAVAKKIMTPIDLVSPAEHPFVTHPTVTNIARFLQSLDDNGDITEGITISIATREAVKSAFTTIDFSEGNFDDQVSDFFNNGADLIEGPVAQAHFFSTMAAEQILPVDLINLGDGFTNGTQSTSIEKINDTSDSKNINVHENTQIHGYPQLIADEISPVVFSDFEWNNPLLKMDSARLKIREADEEGKFFLPYNLGVHGATVEKLLEEKTDITAQVTNEIIKLVLSPIPEDADADKTQLDAAQIVATQEGHGNRMKLFTLWIGIEDVLGAVTAEGGGALTETDIDAFLSAHDLDSFKTDLTNIVNTLTAIEYSYVFVATIPDITRIGALFYKDDLARLATFGEPPLDSLADYIDPLPSNNDVIAIGFHAFESISNDLTSNNDQLNNAIDGLIDEWTLSNNEAHDIRDRIDGINNYIRTELIGTLTTPDPRVFIVEIDQVFETPNSDPENPLPNALNSINRGYGQGFFSMDGIYPSHTGYALIAREFLTKINENKIGISVDLVEFDQTIETIWASDPYRDFDEDGFPAGPGTVGGIDDIDPALDKFPDCDDEDTNTWPRLLYANEQCP